MRTRDESLCECGRVKHRLARYCKTCYSSERVPLFKNQITSKIDDDMLRKIQAIASEHNIDISKAVRLLIEWGLSSTLPEEGKPYQHHAKF